MSDYHHGVRVTEINSGSRPIRTVSTAVIGMVCVSDDADASYFPINHAVLITNMDEAIGKAGNSGTLKAALQAIDDQAQPVCVVVRVLAGADDAATTSNIIGGVNAGQFTGLQALKSAKNNLGVTPRILGVPGYDNLTVTTELVAIAQQLNAMVYAMAHAAGSKEDAVTYRNQFGARELMLLWPKATLTNAQSGLAMDAQTVARALGLRAKIDQQVGWHKTLSNVAINGITGTSHDVFFDLQNPASDAGHLNANEVTTIINQNGWRFWGSRTCSDEPLFAFENYTRTAQILRDTIADAQMWAIDKPLTPGLIKDILGSINAKFREMKARGYLIDASAWYDDAINTPATLKDGKLTIDYDYTPVPPLENMTLQQRITDRYLGDFSAQVESAELV